MKKWILFLCFVSVVNAQTCDSDSINWHDPQHVKKYVEQEYPDLSNEILRTIKSESSFQPFIKNPKSSAIGFMQVTKACAEGLGFSYSLIKQCPTVNIHAGVLYLRQCLDKADGIYEKAMKYYKFGLYYDKIKDK
jgi:soluble lytic murein transglycosylase-like protein